MVAYGSMQRHGYCHLDQAGLSLVEGDRGVVCRFRLRVIR